MSRVFSFRDLRVIPALSKCNEIQLLHPSMDALVNSCLEQLGFDLKRPIQYLPSKHRDLQGKVAVGFRAVGEIAADDRNYITSKMCTLTERLVASASRDPSLARELCNLMGNSINLSDSDGGLGDDEGFPEELVEADHDNIAEEIRNLENLRDQIRGSQYDEAGALKLPGTYV